jgi:hypothetical protein
MATPLPTLDRIDPDEAWRPWQPSAADPWDRKWAAHLYRRAAFGPNRDELAEAGRLGAEGTLDLLLRGGRGADETRGILNDVGRVAAARDDGGEQLRSWWLYCMLRSGHPFREKLTLFWHNHFATSLIKVQDAVLMFRQNCLLRELGPGKFGPLLQAVSRDPAMLVWLDSNSNVKEHPNENYAREVMELFSLGVGNYTEKDVREAARAFTGWHTDGTGFRFDARRHDGGAKTILGQSGNWDGGDVVRIVLGQPQATRFLVRKLYQFFVSETAVPPDSLLEPLCESFRKSDLDVTALIRTMLASRHFYSGYAFRQRIKSPVEYVVGAVRAVYRAYDEQDADYRPLPQQALVNRLGAIGQELFAPPNVKGWPGGRYWLNTSTVLERDNFAEALATGKLWNDLPFGQDAVRNSFSAPAQPSYGPVGSVSTGIRDIAAPPRAFDPARLLEEESVSRPEDVVRVLLDLYMPGGVRPEAREKLVTFVAAGMPVGNDLGRRVRAAVHGILTMPEYQLA